MRLRAALLKGTKRNERLCRLSVACFDIFFVFSHSADISSFSSSLNDAVSYAIVASGISWIRCIHVGYPIAALRVYALFSIMIVARYD